MEPDVRERFERIEANLERTERNMDRLERVLEAVTNSQLNLKEDLETLAQSVIRLGQAAERADARMTRIEENLDLLIRAITRDHDNGRTPE